MSLTTHHIIELLDTIQSFQIVQCQMHHEKVVTDVDKHPVYTKLDDKFVFNRLNLCDAKQRNKRLGCAHSGANLNFERVLEQLESVSLQCTNQISEFKNEFQLAVAKIYVLDHEVGHLEHDLAMCKLDVDTYGKEKLEHDLRRLKTEHRELINLLSKIKSDIEQLIKTEVNFSHI